MRDVDELVKLFRANGFTLARKTKHQIWDCPCGHARITFAVSPGKGNRSNQNTKAILKRTLRQCEQAIQEETT